MSMIFLCTGDYHLGRIEKDIDGNVIKETSPHFEENDKGGCVIVGRLNPETKEQIDSADIFGNYKASAYLKKTLELLQPNRSVDIPNFKEIFLSAFNDGFDICDYCKDFQCANCIIEEWKEDSKDV